MHPLMACLPVVHKRDIPNGRNSLHILTCQAIFTSLRRDGPSLTAQILTHARRSSEVVRCKDGEAHARRQRVKSQLTNSDPVFTSARASADPVKRARPRTLASIIDLDGCRAAASICVAIAEGGFLIASRKTSEREAGGRYTS